MTARRRAAATHRRRHGGAIAGRARADPRRGGRIRRGEPAPASPDRRCRATGATDLEDAERQAGAQLKEAQVAAREELLAQRTEQERDLAERRAELAKAEERVSAAQAQADLRADELGRRDQSIADREVHAKQLQEDLKAARDAELASLERIASMTALDARDALLTRVEQEARSDMARLVRQIEEEARIDADKRARNILSVAIQRTASSHTAETTVSVVQLPSDDLKGRIIGREGRNIRALENLTGVDVIIDDTPQAVVLSAFDGVRREIAKLTIESLIADGRIHPSRIEEMYYQSKAADRAADRAGGRAGLVRGQRPRPAPRADQDPGPAALPHELRPERAQALGRVRPPGVDHGGRARREPEDGPPGGAAARHRQGGHARGRGPARRHLGPDVQEVPRVAERLPRHRGPPPRRRAADGRGGARDRRRRDLGVAAGRPRRERSSTTSSGSRRSRRSRRQRTASSAATPCRRAARSG